MRWKRPSRLFLLTPESRITKQVTDFRRMTGPERVRTGAKCRAACRPAPLGYELQAEAFRMFIESQMRRSTAFGCLAGCATSH